MKAGKTVALIRWLRIAGVVVTVEETEAVAQDGDNDSRVAMLIIDTTPTPTNASTTNDAHIFVIHDFSQEKLAVAKIRRLASSTNQSSSPPKTGRPISVHIQSACTAKITARTITCGLIEHFAFMQTEVTVRCDRTNQRQSRSRLIESLISETTRHNDVWGCKGLHTWPMTLDC